MPGIGVAVADDAVRVVEAAELELPSPGIVLQPLPSRALDPIPVLGAVHNTGEESV
jgi:hypothetical protein